MPEQHRRYFDSPQAAVPIISQLLRQQNYRTLASYYDLSHSTLSYAQLASESFFIRPERPAAAHPAGLWRYKQPFAPGFYYHQTLPTRSSTIFEIQLQLEIDQGMGMPAQISLDSFKMIQSAQGWQILTDE